MIPGVGKALKDVDIDNDSFKGVEAIIMSMTPYEREHPDVINGSRRKRIADGSGTSIAEVNRLLKQFEGTRKMMKTAMTGNLMQRMRRPDIASKGNRLLWLLVAAQVVTTLSHILPQGTFQTVLDALACIFSVVAYVLYLGYLRQSRNVLQA